MVMLRHAYALFAALVFAVGIPGCSDATPKLDGAWRATEVQGQIVSGPTLDIDAQKVSGNAGCNRFNGPIQVDGSTVKFGPLATTRMFCDGKMEAESAYLAALQSATRYEFSADTLSLFGGDDTVVAKFAK